MRARLIVKGDKFQAARAAADRGFPFAFEHEALSPATTVGVTDATIDALNTWVCEDTVSPFPVGSLLHWAPVVGAK
jgi:hypothetical protein